jgi:hypothetical protein
MPRKEGGRGPKQVRDTIKAEEIHLKEYLYNNREKEPFLEAANKETGMVDPPSSKSQYINEW